MTPTSTTWISQNADYAAHRFTPGLRMMPSRRTIVIGCVDPRVDPSEVLGLAPGEAAVIRNVGGRVTPGVLDELFLLKAVTRAAGGDLGPGWEVVVLQHTDCGITRLHDTSDTLCTFFGVDAPGLAAKEIDDPHAAVAVDIAVLRGDARVPGALVTGFVLDVATGLISTVAP